MKVWLQACRVNSLAISSIGVMAGTGVGPLAGYFYASPPAPYGYVGREYCVYLSSWIP